MLGPHAPKRRRGIQKLAVILLASAILAQHVAPALCQVSSNPDGQHVKRLALESMIARRGNNVARALACCSQRTSKDGDLTRFFLPQEATSEAKPEKIIVDGAGATFPEELYADAFFAYQFVDDSGRACSPTTLSPPRISPLFPRF